MFCAVCYCYKPYVFAASGSVPLYTQQMVYDTGSLMCSTILHLQAEMLALILVLHLRTGEISLMPVLGNDNGKHFAKQQATPLPFNT